MHLASKDYKGILDVINTTYGIHDRNTLISTVYKKLEKLIAMHGGIFVPVMDVKRANTDSGVGDAFLYNNPKDLLDIFVRHYVQSSPFVTTGFVFKVRNKAARPSDIMEQSSLRKNRYYNEWLKIAGIRPPMVSMLSSQGDMVGVVCVERPIRYAGFSERQKYIFNCVLPHLSNAIYNCNILKTPITDDVGIIHLGPNGTVLSINHEAKIALNGRMPDSLTGHRLSTNKAILRTENGAWRIRTVSMPYRMEKMIFLEPLSANGHRIPDMSYLNLTPRQEEIVKLLIRGLSNRSIAEKLFIEEQTVRDHLRAVYEKAGVRSRNELTAKILGIDSGI